MSFKITETDNMHDYYESHIQTFMKYTQHWLKNKILQKKVNWEKSFYSKAEDDEGEMKLEKMTATIKKSRENSWQLVWLVVILYICLAIEKKYC